jgi:hypothetical protein
MGKPVAMGGLGWGQGPVSLVLSAIIVAFVAYLAVSRKDIARDRRPAEQLAGPRERYARPERAPAQRGKAGAASIARPRGLAVRLLAWLLFLAAAGVVAFFAGYLFGAHIF